MEKARESFISDDEIHDAAEGLIKWFQSQDLKLIDVIPVCIKVIAIAWYAMGVRDDGGIAKACEVVRVELLACMQGKQ